jgi:hypothetical protein
MFKTNTINISDVLPNISYNGKLAGNIKGSNKQGNRIQIDRYGLKYNYFNSI